MMTGTLYAIGPILATATNDVTADNRQAYSTSLLFAELHAMATVLNIADEAFYTCLRDEMGQIGWTVTDASTTNYHHSGGDGTPASVLQDIAKNTMPASAIAPVTDLMGELQKGSAEGALGNFMTTWWKRVATSGTSTVFSTSPLGLDANRQPAATLAFLDFGLTAESWQSFFVSRVTSDTRITLRSAKIELNTALWKSIGHTVTERLGQTAIDSIASLQLRAPIAAH
jgi:hypothetical protein